MAVLGRTGAPAKVLTIASAPRAPPKKIQRARRGWIVYCTDIARIFSHYPNIPSLRPMLDFASQTLVRAGAVIAG